MESESSLTIGAGPGTGRKKLQMEHNFPFGYSGWEFGLPLKTFRLFWKFSCRANQNSVTIYSPTEISVFFVSVKH